MASIDLLEELELKDYYSQKLSFSDAITLRGEAQNDCPKKYGLEIVRKLLTFDSTAVVSVTSDINNSQNNTVNTEAETNIQSSVDDVRPPWRRNVAVSGNSDNAKSELKLHPMDLLVVVMNCCDDFLRQVLVENMVANKLSIPILLPDLRNGSYTILNFALRSLVPEVQDQIRENSASLDDTIFDVKNPVVSFIRIGKLHRSKSKLVNDLLNPNSFNIFFHRECDNGAASRSVSNGSIEAAWFQSKTLSEEEFNCNFFTALNLRGSAKDYPKQTQFLCQSSTIVVFMVDSFEMFMELYENVLKDSGTLEARIIVAYISLMSPKNDDDIYFTILDRLKAEGVISAVIYDWINDKEQKRHVEFVHDLRKTISKFLVQQPLCQFPTYAKFIQSGQKFAFSIDDDKWEYKEAKSKGHQFIDLVVNQPPDCKPLMLPLQGEPWEQFGKLEREQRRRLLDKNTDEYFIAEKETQKRRQREKQCSSLILQNKIAHSFFVNFLSLPEENDQALLYYLNLCSIKLDARSRASTSNIEEEYKKSRPTHENQTQLSNESETKIIATELEIANSVVGLGHSIREFGQMCAKYKKSRHTHENQTQLSNESEAKISEMELKIAKSVVGLGHFVRELGQMYEAVISEEIRMKEELKKAPLKPDVIRSFPKIVARLLLMGQPLELMDGDVSNVPITWLKAVLNQVRLITNNAKIFVLSIIGIQSSGKSTLLNALFGLQFPVSAGRCTRGIYCQIVPADKGSLGAEYDYVLVVDTEGLRAPQFADKSTFRDNELATFAIGLADATIINLKGENSTDMSSILQIAAHGLIRIRKTKADLELMPRCLFVHHNVPAVDAESKNLAGQENQFMHLDAAVKAAARSEGFTDISKFDDVIKYDSGLHLWYFPDLWNGSPPMARISKDYVRKANQLKQYLMQVMNNTPSKLTISSFFLRMSDLWNAMLHNDFVLCFRNTHEIITGIALNDRISQEMDRFKNSNKFEQTKTGELILSLERIEQLNGQNIVEDLSNAVENNFTIMKGALNEAITGTDLPFHLKEKYTDSLNALKDGELDRIKDETVTDLAIQRKKIENENDEDVIQLKNRLTKLEKSIEEVETDKWNEAAINEFEEEWQSLVSEDKCLIDKRLVIVEDKIKNAILESSTEFCSKYKMQLETNFAENVKVPLDFEFPEVTDNDIVPKKETRLERVKGFVHTKSFASKANSWLEEACKKRKLEFQKQKKKEFDASHLKQVMSEIEQLLGMSRNDGVDEICLPQGYSFTRDYIVKFIKYAFRDAYNRSQENSKAFISLTDPLSDINERRQRSISYFRHLTAEANTTAVSQEIFDYAKGSFLKGLGEIIKTEVCKEENKYLPFESKRAFLNTILIDLGQETKSLAGVNEERKKVFDNFMLYVKMGESEESENFFFSAIKKFFTEMLTKECENDSETEFQKMVNSNVGNHIEKAKSALRDAETKCKGSAVEYIRIFKECMGARSKINIRINNLSGFTEAVVEKLANLYSDYLIQANSLFETLLPEEKDAAIRPLFEKIMGCRERCPFCSAPCCQSLQDHAGDHHANHYPMGVSGTITIWSLFINTQETLDATAEKQRKPNELTVDTCQTMVGTRGDIRTKATVKKYRKPLHRLFKCNYQSFRKYREIDEYKNWNIAHSQDHTTSLFWKWFMAQFAEELAKHYSALCPKLPEAWEQVTWEEAKKSLDEHDMNFYFEVEDTLK